MKILIAEDDFVSRSLLQKTLEGWGHEVNAAEDGQKAWDLLQREGAKIVIADWIMPEIDGISLCRKIRASQNSGYVYYILLTGNDRKDDIIQGLEAGADDYISKPFEREELRMRLRTGERILDLERTLNKKNQELIDLNAKLEDLACLDPLTGIGNRRSFFSTIEKMHHRACRYDQHYSLIMIDIDNFKDYNDTYGHLAGDRILNAVANAISHSLRTSDEVFRYGGEEMVVTLPDQDLNSTAIVAERIRKNVELLGIEHDNSSHGMVTISCGIATFERDCDQVQKWESIIDRADKALYRAKASGKNRVTI